ncbi:MAG: hypothetical protein H6708_13450 [Kofleriaceae bacterium]|nr:hypothetical protein [Kofleriaceae bacterium]
MSASRRLSSLLLSLSLVGTACTSVARTPDATPRPDPGKVVVAPRPAPELDRAAVRAALAERRDVTYQRFLAYREARVYPVNTFTHGYQHVWLDAQGHLCAAATIISGDWGREITSHVAAENNFIRMADVKDGPLLDWVLTSGLTHHEIVAIQVPGWQPDPRDIAPAEPDPQAAEIARLYTMYIDVERQLTSTWDESIDDATDALMKHPELARALLDGRVASPGRFADDPEPVATSTRFAQPPA